MKQNIKQKEFLECSDIPSYRLYCNNDYHIKTHGYDAAGNVNEILIPRSLTIEHMRVLFDARFTSISFFRQSIFDVLNFQREL